MYEKFQPKPRFKVIMCGCKLFGSYPCDHEHKRDFQKMFPKLKVYLSLSKFSNGMIKSGLNNGLAKSGVVNMSTQP